MGDIRYAYKGISGNRATFERGPAGFLRLGGVGSVVVSEDEKGCRDLLKEATTHNSPSTYASASSESDIREAINRLRGRAALRVPDEEEVVGREHDLLPSDTVLDPINGLLWTKKDNGSEVFHSSFWRWNNAQRYCKKLRLGGFSDWRLPTIDELAGLYEEGAGSHNCRLGIELTAPWVWSSTKGGVGRYPKIWRFLFNRGSRHQADLGGHLGVVLCVREY